MSVVFAAVGDSRAYWGHALLNRPRQLNALNTQMVVDMGERLRAWAADPACIGLILSGNGERGFCAGGDVKALAVLQAGETTEQRLERVRTFFSAEYALDEQIWRFPKPSIALADGLAMGGGAGLMQGCDFRVVTPRTLFAMPETAIGFFPDVGASWFLNRVHEGFGELLGISGMHLSAADTLNLGLADYCVPDAAALLEDLTGQQWGEDIRARIAQGLRGRDERSGSAFMAHRAHMAELRDAPNIAERHAGLLGLSGDAWLEQVASTASRGSSLSVVATHRLLAATRLLGLSECFAADMAMALHLSQHEEFAEGVRAVLVDKDHQPRWRYGSVAAAEAYDFSQVLPTFAATA